MSSESNVKSARNTALNYLSRREHSRQELYLKLQQKQFSDESIDIVLDRLSEENLQNDSRFAENYIRYRYQKGFGPLKIRHELQQRGVSADVLERQMSVYSEQWPKLLNQQRNKKFGQVIPTETKEKQKQQRFLQNKGFSIDSVMRLFR